MMGNSIGPSKSAIDDLLQRNPTKRQLRSRINALMRLMEDCQRFFPLPTLIESLRADIDRLREHMPAQRKEFET